MREKEKDGSNLSRRQFIGTAVVAGAALAACTTPGEETVRLGDTITPGPETAPDGPVLKAGLIGCGGRGTGAALNYLEAAPSVELVAMSDVFQDRIDSCRQKLQTEKGVEIPDENCFVGFDGDQKVIDSGVDVVLIATPPQFRPRQFEAAVDARKHVFMEKPVAVDPVGARSIMSNAEKADAFGLKVVTGTQRRHEKQYIETYNRIMEGAIGPIVAARCYWNQSQLWFRERQPEWSDMEFMIRDWVNWGWLSGDHIVEQHVHNIDVINWFTNSHPVRAVGMGGRHRRVTGDQYDFFAVDYEMENGVHVLSMCRQIDGCANNVSEYVVGTKGSSNCKDTIFDAAGNVLWKYGSEQGSEAVADKSPYVQEHTDLVTAIRNDTPMNEANNTATSTLVAIMGRISAYTGQETTWDEMMQSSFSLSPESYEMGASDRVNLTAPVPGSQEA